MCYSRGPVLLSYTHFNLVQFKIANSVMPSCNPLCSYTACFRDVRYDTSSFVKDASKKMFSAAEKEKRSARQKVISSPPPNSAQPQLSSLQQMSSAIVFPTCEWSNHSPADMSRLQLCNIPQVCGNSSQPLRIAFNVIVNADLSWSLFVYDYKVSVHTCSCLECFLTNLNAESLNKLLSMLESLKICAGQPEGIK